MTVGLICEYNPFHNGHIYHIEETKRITGASQVIVILTGYFTMRGELSVISLKDKVLAALSYGVDIVIELPYLCGTQNADLFAYNSVALLNQMHVDKIVAGSETCEYKTLTEIATLEKKPEFQALIRKYLSDGFSYPKSFQMALQAHNQKELMPNDLLNLKYYEAIQKINSRIEFQMIQRIKANYHDQTINPSTIQSATAIRKAKDIEAYVPKEIFECFCNKGFYQEEKYFPILKHLLYTTDLSTIFGMTEGIENSFKEDFCSLLDLVEKLTTKRYTTSRIKRIVTYILTNTTKSEMENLSLPPVRVLGFTENGQKYLHSIKKEGAYFTRLISKIHPVYDKEITIAKILGNIYQEDFLKMEQSFPIKK